MICGLRNKSLIFIITAIASPAPVHDCLAQPVTDYRGLTVPANPVLPPAEGHPAQYFRRTDIPSLIRRKESAAYSQIIREIRSDARFYLNGEAAAQNYANRPRMAKTLAFWWIIEGDTTALRKSIDALLLAYQDVPPSCDLPYDEIRRATWLQNYCAAYDWVHSELSPEQDSAIRTTIAGQTQWLRDNLIDGIRMACGLNNHRSKPAWAIGTAALTLSSHPNAPDWLEFALEQQNEVTGYIFTADGINREGGHYWAFCAINYIPFLHHYLNVSGVDLFPFYQPVFEWPVKIRMGQGWIPNYEDGFLQITATHMVASRYLETYSDLNSSWPLGHVLQWHYLNTNIHTKDYTGANGDVTWEVDAFILFDAAIEPVAPDSPATLMLDGGQIAFRNRWEGGQGHRYLFFHGVPEARNHNHPDQLSFTVEANDAYLIADAGYGGLGYQDDKRYSWYTVPEAHNIITVDTNPAVDLKKDTAPVTPYFFHSDFFDFAEKWNRFAHKKDLIQKRAICFVDHAYWIVTDNLTGCDALSSFRSYLHGRGDFSIQNNHATWLTSENKYGKTGKLDAYLFPNNGKFQVHDGFISLFYDETPEKYVCHEQYKTDAVFMQILIPGCISDAAPEIRDRSTDECLAVDVQFHDTTDTFILKTGLAPGSIDFIKTDGTFAWTRRIGTKLAAVALREATFIQSGELDMKCYPAATLALHLSESELSIFTSENSDLLSLEFYSGTEYQKISSVTINDIPVQFIYSNYLSMAIFNATVQSDNHQDWTMPVRIWPNPFNYSASIEFDVIYDDTFNIAVYNQTGQIIRQLKNEFLRKGISRTQWNGRNDKGEPVASGIYYVSVRGSLYKYAQTHKIVLLK
ncbi:heparinase II/III family protein [bacterium]|nr:heparinase II/III family protein [bacterium]